MTFDDDVAHGRLTFGQNEPGHGRGHYTHGHEAPVLAAHSRRTATNSAAYLLDHLYPGMNLLDVGFGPGTLTLDLAEKVAPGTVVGIENSQAPFATARANAAKRGNVTTRFEFADVLDLPYPEDSFDVVHAHQVLQHVSDPVRALREMARVCRPGGWVAARDADYGAMSWYPDIPAVAEWRDVYRVIAMGNGGEPEAGRHMRAWANAAGLRNARITVTTWCYADAESCAWWGESQAQRVESETFRREARDVGLDKDDVARLARGWREWAKSQDAFFLIPHTEILAHP